MVKKINQGLIIILDVGKNVAEKKDKDKSFFEKGIELATRIIERKILSRGNDYLGLILLGSKKTLNNMAEQCEGGFRNIETFFKLQQPLWKLIKDLQELEPTKRKGDWVEALTVAADHVQNEVSGVNFVNIKIILISNLPKTTCSEKNVKMVLDGLMVYKYDIDIFGPDIYDEEDKNTDLLIAREFVKNTNGESGTFEEIMQYLRFHKKKAIAPRAWNVELNIGPYINIPVSAYARLKDDDVVEKWKESVKDPVTLKRSSTEAIVKETIFYNAQDQSTVDGSNITKVYTIGHRSIPISEFDESLLYKPGLKSLSLYGFTLASNVHWQHLKGKGLSYVFGRKGDKKAQQAITCLVKILHEKNMVGIARQVYNNNYSPKMFALMPVIDTQNYMCLSMAELCYKEAIKYMLFPAAPVKKYPCTNDQVNAMKNLIKAMDLTNAYDETYDGSEAFPTGEIVSPAAQYKLDCLAHRALNPNEPLPPPRDDIMTLFKIPTLIEKRSQEPLKRIKGMFTLQKVEERVKRRRKKLQDVGDVDEPMISVKNENEDDIAAQKISLPDVSNDKYSIGTINPIKDFSVLVSEGKSLTELTPMMTDVIESLLFYNLDGTYTKALATMTHFRNECVKSDPSLYNDWLQKFKVDLTNRNRQDLQVLIKDKGVDFILKSENNNSLFETIISHEESQLYEVDTVPESTEMLIDPDIDAMFDEM